MNHVVVVDYDEDVNRMWDSMYGLREALNRTSDPLQPACFFCETVIIMIIFSKPGIVMIIMEVPKFTKYTHLVCAPTIYSLCFRDPDCEGHFEQGEHMR